MPKLHVPGDDVSAEQGTAHVRRLDRLARHFIAAGVEKIRVTGGEPLVRREIMELFHGLSR
jgi:molybdenum cofactor biosynthesis enzyme MoaA